MAMGKASKVLVVEDEMLIAMYVEDCLLDAEYHVLMASDADKALVLLEADPEIQTVITDIDMPGSMDGLDLAACVRRKWPRISIVVASGKYRPEVQHIPDGAIYISKPYLGSDLLDVMKLIEAA